MANKDVQFEIKKDLQESFKILYFWLSHHKKLETLTENLEGYFKDIDDLMKMSDDVDLKVKFIYTLTNGEVNHTRYQYIQKFITDGVDIDGDIESIQAQVKAVVRRNKHVLESDRSKPFFLSDEFIIKENINGKENGVIVSLQDIQEFSGNRIRFAANETLEV